MQKKLIALAVAGLVAAPAFAQSNVTIYGLVDVGIAHRGDNIKDEVGSKTGLDSGIQSGNRIGFRGVEDLGNGLKASFVLETGLNIDRGGLSNNGGTGTGFGRQTFLALSGGFGTVALGRQYTPQFNMIGAIDPFGNGTVGQAMNLYDQDVRLDNLVAYVSPSFGGFSVTAGYTFNAAGNETLGNDTDAKVWAINPVYKNGPIYASFNYHKIDPTASGAESTKVWDLGGTYDFGVVKAALAYGSRKTSDVQDNRYWLVGATVPVGSAGSVLGSYTHWKDRESDAKAGQWALGYQHDLSKRTNLYAVYADINNKDGGARSVGDASNGGEGYQNGFQVGIRHKF